MTSTSRKRLVGDGHSETEFVGMLRTSITKLARSQRSHRQRDMRALAFSLSSALSTLERLGPMTATQLAALEGVRKPSMTRAVAALEERGLIKRTVSPDDARRVVVQITRAGVSSVQESRHIVDEWYSARLRQLSPEDINALKSAVGALSRLAQETV